MYMYANGISGTSCPEMTFFILVAGSVTRDSCEDHSRKVSGYDQEIPQSHTTKQPTAP